MHHAPHCNNVSREISCNVISVGTLVVITTDNGDASLLSVVITYVYTAHALRSLVQEKYNSIRIVQHGHGTGRDACHASVAGLKEVVGRRRTGIKMYAVRHTCRTFYAAPARRLFLPPSTKTHPHLPGRKISAFRYNHHTYLSALWRQFR